ncbi:hypothetical protein HK099_001753 [Clydaea vesicula]|uniref:Uncharacterized protein n=1 Tax=Clydaea vesicula TaxID=447962 RepID=A0AAD5TW32_9FUNG|nr:hypothetical protein HK099_001753 [Clydaea vesicula]KAJ3381525.1 hypothetical protein HDU92_005289 [Lobulomyces angularis]
MDLFIQKIKVVKIKDYFDDFEVDNLEGQNTKVCRIFFEKKFRQAADNVISSIHYTTSTDSKLIRKVINSVMCLLLEGAVSSIGLVN